MKRVLAIILVLGMLILIGGCTASRQGISRDEMVEYVQDYVRRISQEINKNGEEIKDLGNTVNKVVGVQEGTVKILDDHEKRITNLEKPTPPPPPSNEDKGTWLVYKASQPITSGTIEFDATGLSIAGTAKDVMFVLTNGMEIANYESYRFDIRKYEGGRHLMKSVFVNKVTSNFAVEKYWMSGALIYWEPTHIYHFTVTWGDHQVSASRKDTNTGEKIEVSLNYSAGGEFGPTYIMIGWNPKYGIPPGGYYSNVKLPSGISYELVKYKP